MTKEQLKTLQSLRDELAWGTTPEGTMCVTNRAVDQLLSAVIALSSDSPMNDYAKKCVLRALEEMENPCFILAQL